MMRIRIAGMSLLAALALGAAAASPAYAGEFGVCLKTAKVDKKYSGDYINKECTKPEPGGEGKYRWYPGRSGIGQPGVTSADFEFTSKAKDAFLATPTGGDISCGATTGVGRILGTQLNEETTRYTKCTLSITHGKCTSTGLAGVSAGEIVAISTTYLLDHGTKGPGGLEPPEGAVWNVFLAKEGSVFYPDQTVYTCEPNLLFRTSGSLTGAITGVDHMSAKFKTNFGEGMGEQDLTTIYSENGGQSYMQTGPNVATTVGTSTTDDKSKIEVRACIEQPVQGAPKCESEEALPW